MLNLIFTKFWTNFVEFQRFDSRKTKKYSERLFESDNILMVKKALQFDQMNFFPWQLLQFIIDLYTVFMKFQLDGNLLYKARSSLIPPIIWKIVIFDVLIAFTTTFLYILVGEMMFMILIFNHRLNVRNF